MLVLVLIGVAVALTAERLKERTDNSMAPQGNVLVRLDADVVG